MSSWWPFFQTPDPQRVVRDFGPQVYKHLKRIFGPAADVDDVYQTVFVEVLRSLPAFAGRSKLSTWIRRITWNVAFQEMRVHYRERAWDERLAREPLVSSTPPHDAEHQQVVNELYEALFFLDPKCRLAVVLHDLEGQTLKEIAETLGKPLQTVASHLHNGRAQLVERLRDFHTKSQSIQRREEVKKS